MAEIDLTNLACIIERDYYKPLKHLLPASKKHSEETAGGRVLNMLQQIIPWENMLSSTHLKNLYADPEIQDKDRDHVLEALRVCYNLRKEYAHEIAAQTDYQKKLDAIVKYRQIHCIDAAFLTAHALNNLGYKAYVIDLIDHSGIHFDRYLSHHSMTLYAETDKEMSLEEMFKNLKSDKVRIVDYWVNEQGNAANMLNLLNERFKKTNRTILCSINTELLGQTTLQHKKFVLEPDCGRGHELYPAMTPDAYNLLFHPAVTVDNGLKKPRRTIVRGAKRT